MTGYALLHATDPRAYYLIAVAVVMFVVSVWGLFHITHPDRPYLDAAPAFAALALVCAVHALLSLILFGVGIGLWIAR